jgi:hypothetical protein
LTIDKRREKKNKCRASDPTTACDRETQENKSPFGRGIAAIYKAHDFIKKFKKKDLDQRMKRRGVGYDTGKSYASSTKLNRARNLQNSNSNSHHHHYLAAIVFLLEGLIKSPGTWCWSTEVITGVRTMLRRGERRQNKTKSADGVPYETHHNSYLITIAY